ncbi:MAG TPA: GntR family transcriptional regulator [Steroidobacteraceae bacterium]|nr:GntR family transcriptional regulator [Acetobacteraceae bacterium]HVC30549.1 GntR family transcriptional regulator [Steroidobacteraceae bacterium]
MPAKPKAQTRPRSADARPQMFERSPIPLYIQVATLLRNRIADGHFRPGQKMPTLDALEQEFGVARVTVRQAVEMLEKEGLVSRQQGRGTFVSQHMRERRWLHLTVDIESLVQAISTHVPRFIAFRNPPALPALLPGDGRLAPDYQPLLSVQYRSGEPFAVAAVHLERTIFEKAPQEYKTRTALPLLLQREQADIGRAQISIVVGNAGPETSERLRIALNSPTAEARYIVENRAGLVIYLAEVIYRGDCVRFDIDLLRSAPAKQAKRHPHVHEADGA